MKVITKVNINYNGESYSIGDEFEYDEKKYPREDLEDIFEIVDKSNEAEEDSKEEKEDSKSKVKKNKKEVKDKE